MNKCLVLFVEGDTEVEFYKKVIQYIRQVDMEGRLDIHVEFKNVKGVGGFKKFALRKFIKEIVPNYKDEEFYIALCRDTDVFELALKPPVNWEEVEAAFRKQQVKDVLHIEARRSIEDWFLYDIEGIKTFLRLKKSTKVQGSTGYEKMKNLFKCANKMYFKGKRSNGLIEHLDISKIIQKTRTELLPLFKVFEKCNEEK